MTDRDFEKDYDKHCKECKKCMKGAWCVEYLCNMNKAIQVCRQSNFEKELKKVD